MVARLLLCISTLVVTRLASETVHTRIFIAKVAGVSLNVHKVNVAVGASEVGHYILTRIEVPRALTSLVVGIIGDRTVEKHEI